MSREWDDAPVGLLAVDGTGLVRAANRTVATWTGIGVDQLVDGHRITDLLSVAGRIYWETHLAPLLHTGEDVAEVALELLSPAGRMPVLLSAHPTPDGLVSIALASAGHRREYERRVRTAGRAAQAAATALRGLQQATVALSAAVGTTAVGTAAVVAAVEALGARSAQLWVPREGPMVLVASHGEDLDAADPPAVVPSLGTAVVDGEDLLVALRGQAGHAGLPGVLHGVLRLTQRGEAGADPVDVELVTALGLQASLALDRAVSYQRTASIAQQLQRSLLAVPVPRDARFSVATVYRPGEETLDVGGDWYDVFLTGADRLSIVVGDVVGHGLGAAAAMGQLRSAVRAVAVTAVGPAALLEHLDRFVDQLPPAELATVAYGRLDLDSGELRHACAGHLPPVLLPASGGAQLLWGGRGTPLSGFLGGSRADADQLLAPGDRLVLCTDGLIERRDRSLDQGLEALLAAALSLRTAPPEEAAQEMTRMLLVDEVVRDDVCVLVLDWHGPHPDARGGYDGARSHVTAAMSSSASTRTTIPGCSAS